MTQQDINKGLCFFESQVDRFETLPGQILMRANTFIEAISKDAGWSFKKAQLFTNLLLGNKMLELRGSFLHLTSKGYAVINAGESDVLFIDLRNLLFNPNNPVEKT